MKYAKIIRRITETDNVTFRTQNCQLKIMSAIVPKDSGNFISSIKLVAQSTTTDVWDDFLQLQISDNTKRTYASALNDFFVRLTGSGVNPQQIQEFLLLSQFEAVGVVLKYKGLLLDLGLAPSTINTRLSAVKSLTSHARKLGRCGFSLEDITHVHVEKYRDTSGVGVEAYRQILNEVDRESLKGKRDYAILRLLWDNALRRGELVATNVGDFREGKLWIIGKGKTQQQSIDLAPRTLAALEEWLAVRGGAANEPIFIALDGRSHGKRLAGRSVARVVDWVATDAGVTKHLSPHRIRHSSITAFLDASGGDVRTAQRLSRHSRLDTLMIYDDNRKGLQGKASGILADLV
jgi:integrase/recombinase XerC